MSDPLTNMEIQDVLSSIRRLVSEDSRHKAEQEKARGDDRPGSGARGKLVLTEALRVPEADSAVDDADMGEDGLREAVAGDGVFEEGVPVPAIGEDQNAPEADLLKAWDEDSDAEMGDAQSLEDTIAELEAAVAGIGGEFEPDGSEVAKGAVADSALEDAFEDGFAVDEAADDDGVDLAQPVTSGELHHRGDWTPEESLERGDEAVEPEATADHDDWVEEAPAEAGDERDRDGEPDVAAGTDAAFESVEQEADEGGEIDLAETAQTADDVLDEEDTGGEMAAGETDEGGAIPAFVHSGSLRSLRDVSDNDDEAPVSTGRIRRLTLTAADAVTDAEAPWDRGDDIPQSDLLDAAEPHGDAADEAGDDDDGAALFSAGDEAVIDMEMLRDLVAEIIREELQGPLGERITRNVRMLVRREINRALESRGLE